MTAIVQFCVDFETANWLENLATQCREKSGSTVARKILLNVIESKSEEEIKKILEA